VANVLTGAAQYHSRFAGQSIAGSQYALTKLGIDRSNCSIKIEDYLILCVPFQLGLARSVFMASLSKQEMLFFQKYLNTTVGLSIALNPNKKPEPFKFFLRCSLVGVGPMKGRENVGLFVLDYKTTPDIMVSMLGNFMENQERLKVQYNDYGNSTIKITPEVAKLMGYNLYATVTDANTPATEPRRIQVLTLNSKHMEHVEAAGSPIRKPSTPVSYQLFFQKFRVTVNGTIGGSGPLPQGIIRTAVALDFSPELVEIIDEYWYSSNTNSLQA